MTAIAAFPTFRLRLLGAFALETSEGELLPVPPSAQRVLAYLGTHRQPVHRASAAGVLWPDTGQDKACRRLRSALWRIPRPGRRLVDIDTTWLGLPACVTVDYRTADEAPNTASNTAAREPSGLASVEELSHDLLPDWDEPWLVAERERFHQRRLHGLESLAGRHLAERDYAGALRAALAAVAGEPLRESAHRLVIATHLAEANPAEALRQYHACARLLHRELGLPPAPPTRALVQALLHDADRPTITQQPRPRLSPVRP